MKTAVHTPAAVAAMVAADDRENERAAFWMLVPPPARVVVMMVARMPRERANDPLWKFSDEERRYINGALTVLSSHLDIAARCMSDAPPATKAALH
ncbi:hypothetical protein [Duganella sp. BuS-21]|uniref:hypothetical protein n=1 Tax=Duganella sp. BuS-21 TaxID=2943848 RepID=UPI0035A7481F